MAPAWDAARLALRVEARRARLASPFALLALALSTALALALRQARDSEHFSLWLGYVGYVVLQSWVTAFFSTICKRDEAWGECTGHLLGIATGTVTYWLSAQSLRSAGVAELGVFPLASWCALSVDYTVANISVNFCFLRLVRKNRERNGVCENVMNGLVVSVVSIVFVLSLAGSLYVTLQQRGVDSFSWGELLMNGAGYPAIRVLVRSILLRFTVPIIIRAVGSDGMGEIASITSVVELFFGVAGQVAIALSSTWLSYWLSIAANTVIEILADEFGLYAQLRYGGVAKLVVAKVSGRHASRVGTDSNAGAGELNTASASEKSDEDALKLDPDLVLRAFEVRFCAEDFAEKILSLSSPFVPVFILLLFPDTTVAGLTSWSDVTLQLAVPRMCCGLAFEIAGDVVKTFRFTQKYGISAKALFHDGELWPCLREGVWFGLVPVAYYFCCFQLIGLQFSQR